MKSLRFILTMEHHHKVKVRKVIVTSSKVTSRGPEWCLNINKIGWDGMHPRSCHPSLSLHSLCGGAL